MSPILIPKLRTNEQHSQGEEDEREEREKEEDEGEEDGSSEEEFNQHLSLFPELLLDSQVFATRLFSSNLQSAGLQLKQHI